MRTFGSDEVREQLCKEYAHRVPDAEAQAKLRELRQATLNLAVFMDRTLPPGRAKSVAQTKLDEVRMWACSAIVATGEIREPLSPSV